MRRYADRTEAGRVLAEALSEYRHAEDLLVLGLPRGGVGVAREVAEALGAELDVWVVRKLGVPGQEELAMGAVASGGARVLDARLIEKIHITPEHVEAVVERELEELQRRERVYRGDRTPPNPAGRCVILVDDGLATGSTMRSAVQAVRQGGAARIVVAVPVAPNQSVRAMESIADVVVCPMMPRDFRAVGQWYERFDQLSDTEVCEIMESYRGDSGRTNRPRSS